MAQHVLDVVAGLGSLEGDDKVGSGIGGNHPTLHGNGSGIHIAIGLAIGQAAEGIVLVVGSQGSDDIVTGTLERLGVGHLGKRTVVLLGKEEHVKVGHAEGLEVDELPRCSRGIGAGVVKTDIDGLSGIVAQIDRAYVDKVPRLAGGTYRHLQLGPGNFVVLAATAADAGLHIAVGIVDLQHLAGLDIGANRLQQLGNLVFGLGGQVIGLHHVAPHILVGLVRQGQGQGVLERLQVFGFAHQLVVGDAHAGLVVGRGIGGCQEGRQVGGSGQLVGEVLVALQLGERTGETGRLGQRLVGRIGSDGAIVGCLQGDVDGLDVGHLRFAKAFQLIFVPIVATAHHHQRSCSQIE